MGKPQVTSTSAATRSPFADDMDELPSMSMKNRITGFVFCVILGIFFCLLAYSAITAANPKLFAIFYVLANFIFISGTAFIVGPGRQCQLMFTAERIMSSLIYLAATVAVFLTAIRGKVILATILIVVQILSLIWYTLSYIPYAQKLLSTCFGV